MTAAGAPTWFELVLPPLALEAGATVERHVVRGWHWGPAEDAAALAAATIPVDPARRWQVTARSTGELAALARRQPRGAVAGAGLAATIPTVVVVHALTGDAGAGGDDGWWAPLIGPGRAIDPTQVRVLCLNLLGSCYGTSGPGDGGFPRLADDGHAAELTPARGGFAIPAVDLPATITTWDQARSITAALDRLGVERVEAVLGGSLGGMVALALAALDPDRYARLVPIAATTAASPWILAWNHVGRQAILADPGFPTDAHRGLELARQLAMITYRAEADTGRVTVTVPYTESGKEDWAAKLSFSQVMNQFTESTQLLFSRAPDLKQLHYVGVWQDKEVARIEVSRAEWSTLQLREVEERIGSLHGRVFQELSLGKGNDESADRSMNARVSAEYRKVLAQLKGHAFVSPQLK